MNKSCFPGVLITVQVLFFVYCVEPMVISEAAAQDGQVVSMQEVVQLMGKYASLPEYCRIRLTERDIVIVKKKKMPKAFLAVRNRWQRRFGRNWTFFHHYCWGIRRLNQAKSMAFSNKNKMLRKGTLRWALEDFEFMRRAADKDFPLWPQLLMYEAQVHLELGEVELAQELMRQSYAVKQKLNSR